MLESDLRLLGKEDFFNGPMDLLGFHTINNGIHHWKDKQIHISHKGVNIRRCIFPKPMEKAQAIERDIEDGKAPMWEIQVLKALRHSSGKAMLRMVLIIRI